MCVTVWMHALLDVDIWGHTRNLSKRLVTNKLDWWLPTIINTIMAYSSSVWCEWCSITWLGHSHKKLMFKAKFSWESVNKNFFITRRSEYCCFSTNQMNVAGDTYFLAALLWNAGFLLEWEQVTSQEPIQRFLHSLWGLHEVSSTGSYNFWLLQLIADNNFLSKIFICDPASQNQQKVAWPSFVLWLEIGDQGQHG